MRGTGAMIRTLFSSAAPGAGMGAPHGTGAGHGHSAIRAPTKALGSFQHQRRSSDVVASRHHHHSRGPRSPRRRLWVVK